MYPPREEIIAALVAHLREGIGTVEELAEYVNVSTDEIEMCLDLIRPVLDQGDEAIAKVLSGIEWEVPSEAALAVFRFTGSGLSRAQRRLAGKRRRSERTSPSVTADGSAVVMPPLPSRPTVAGPRQLKGAAETKRPAMEPSAPAPEVRNALTDEQHAACLEAAIQFLKERAGFLGRVHGPMDVTLLHKELHVRVSGLDVSEPQVQRQVVNRLVASGHLVVCASEHGGCWHLLRT